MYLSLKMLLLPMRPVRSARRSSRLNGLLKPMTLCGWTLSRLVARSTMQLVGRNTAKVLVYLCLLHRTLFWVSGRLRLVLRLLGRSRGLIDRADVGGSFLLRSLFLGSALQCIAPALQCKASCLLHVQNRGVRFYSPCVHLGDFGITTHCLDFTWSLRRTMYIYSYSQFRG
jgi:hypothetical protein